MPESRNGGGRGRSRNRNDGALTNMDAKRKALRLASDAIDALGVRLGTLTAILADDRTEEAAGRVMADFDGLASTLHEASRTSQTLKRLLHDPADQPMFVAPMLEVRRLLTREAAARGRAGRIGLHLLRLLDAPRRMWRAWRREATADRRAKADAAERKALSQPPAASGQAADAAPSAETP